MAERRYTFMLYAAVLTAAGATFGVYKVLERTKESSRIAMRPVVVAAADLPEGTRIDRAMLTEKPWPVSTVPAGAFAYPDSLIGRVTRVPVFNGEPIVPGRLAPDGTGPGLEVKITPGKRGMPIRINDVSGIDGLIQPNSRVDVMVMLNATEQTGGTNVAKLFMSNMRVLAVGQSVERSADGRSRPATTATLEVTPDEAERLGVAQKNGELQLVLRGYGDADTISTRGARSGDVLAQLSGTVPTTVKSVTPQRRSTRPPQVAAPAPAPAPAPMVEAPPPPKRPDSLAVQIYRGATATQLKFEKDSTKKKPQDD